MISTRRSPRLRLALLLTAAALLLGLLPASTSALTATPWSGTWGTASFGTMTLTQTGSSVTGTYTYEEGQIAGTASGNTLTGTWTEVPTRQGSDAGPFIFTLAVDGRSWTGLWAHTGEAPTRTDWNGTCTGGGCTGAPPTPAVPPGAPPGQPKIVGPPLFRIIGVGGVGFEHKSGADGATRELQLGWLLGVGDRVTARGSLRINGGAEIRVQAIPSGAIYTFKGAAIPDVDGNFLATPAVFDVDHVLTLRQGELEVDTKGPRTQARNTQAGGSAVILTPVARTEVNGVARVSHDPRRRRSTVGNVRGSVDVTPSNATLRGIRLVPGKQVEVSASGITAPFDLVPNLETTIPSPRQVRAGPTVVTAPSRLSLRSLKRSKCVAVSVSSTRAARVLVTIFSGRRSVRLFGQKLVRFAVAGRKSTCIKVPARARTFNVRTPLSFAVGYALGARARSGQRPTRPVIRPITLVP